MGVKPASVGLWVIPCGVRLNWSRLTSVLAIVASFFRHIGPIAMLRSIRGVQKPILQRDLACVLELSER